MLRMVVLGIVLAGVTACDIDDPMEDHDKDLKAQMAKLDTESAQREQQRVQSQPSPPTTAEDMDRYIHRKVIADMIGQWQIVQRSGSQVDKCVMDGTLGQAYLQAKDASGYAMMKRHQEMDCPTT